MLSFKGPLFVQEISVYDQMGAKMENFASCQNQQVTMFFCEISTLIPVVAQTTE